MAKNITGKIFKSSIIKNLSVLISGTVFAQLIVVAFQIILRRVFSPDDFGSFAVYMSLVGILATISSLRYEQTIILPQSNNEGKTLLWVSWILTLIFSLILVIPFGLFYTHLASFLNLPKAYAWWLCFIPLSLFAFSINQAFNFYLIRQKRFKLSAANKVLRRSAEGGTQTVFGFIGIGAGLFIGDLIGQVALFINTLFKKNNGSLAISEPLQLKSLIKKYQSFPIKNGVPSLMNAVSLLLPVIIINQKFNQEVTGYFDLARMVLILPLSLITASLSQVLLQRFAERKNAQLSIKNEALSTFMALLGISSAFCLVIYFGGEFLFSWIFGKEWNISGHYASILVWAFALKFIVSPFNIVFTAFEKIGILSFWQVIYFAAILLLYWYPVADINQFLKLYLIIELLSYGLAAIFNLIIIGQYEINIKKIH